MLDGWDDQKDYGFMFVAAHELAHWLVLETEGEFPSEDKHGVAWAICQDLLEYLFTDNYSATAYKEYHPDDIRSIMDIERVVNDLGIPALDSVRSSRDLSKNDVKSVTHECMKALASYRCRF